MSWRPIDFLGVINLEPSIVDQLEHYLQEKETRLAYQILQAISGEAMESSQPRLSITPSMKLSEAVDSFTKQVRAASLRQEVQKAPEEQQRILKFLNRSLWEYTEILEGCVVELFQQVQRVPFSRWHISLSVVVQDLKGLLLHRIEDLMWMIKRLEKPVSELFMTSKSLKSLRWLRWRTPSIDDHLLENLQQTEKALKSQFSEFKRTYHDYLTLSIQAEECLEKMKGYPILAQLDMQDQNVYIDVFRLLKMLEVNPRGKKVIAKEVTRALEHLTSSDHIAHLFNLYLKAFQEAFFHCSLEWKSLNHEENHYLEASQKIKAKVTDLQHELREFMVTMSRYRTYLLKNNANPYVRSRLGFTEWIVGPEPSKAKQLRELLFSADHLNDQFTLFAQSLERDPLNQQNVEYHAHEEIEKLLHEMGQPLISRTMMINRAEKFLDALKTCDEIGSPQISTIYYVEDKLSKAMRADWKYHVLHEFPLFHQLYRLHKGLEEVFDDPAHVFRMDRLQLLFTQITKWVGKGKLDAHVHGIELDMNDMKTYLQDFLAAIQRAAKDKSVDPFFDEALCKFTQQLLEYRYIFGRFFHHLMNKNSNAQHLRYQFLFVDQYLETTESLLNDLKGS